ncbi:hypothetical protein [Sporosarcina obsidiansis]|nr:hypothetical protein [Sporosarcina obsidiansis]
MLVYNQARLEQIVMDTDGIRWGFHDQLAYLYGELLINDDYEG